MELWSRRGREWTAEFPSIAAAAASLQGSQALLDGEVAVVLPSGITSFQASHEVVKASRLVRKMLAGLHLRSWVKTNGGRGLHVVMPIQPTDAASCPAFARAVAGALVEHDPVRFTTANAKAGRERQLLIDTLRNNRTNTSVAGYSLRALRGNCLRSIGVGRADAPPGAGPLHGPSLPRRLRRVRDPWAEYW